MNYRTVPAETPDPHLAAYAKGLEDAARWLDAQEAEHILRCFFESAKLLNGCASAIRALSPLPAGTRVVAQVQIGETCPMCGHVAEPLPDEAIAALRALTGGDDRGRD